MIKLITVKEVFQYMADNYIRDTSTRQGLNEYFFLCLYIIYLKEKKFISTSLADEVTYIMKSDFHPQNLDDASFRDNKYNSIDMPAWWDKYYGYSYKNIPKEVLAYNIKEILKEKARYLKHILTLL